MKKGKQLGFSQVVHCNICNPQQLDQQPITFFRQVAALTEYPELMRDPKKIEGLFPTDAIERAQTLLKGFKTLGAYSHSKGNHAWGFLTQQVSPTSASGLPNLSRVRRAVGSS